MKAFFAFWAFFIITSCLADTVTGVIYEAGKQAIPGAKVSIFRSEESKVPLKTVLSGKNGQFRFDNLTPGYYRVVVSKAFFCDGSLGRIEVNQAKFGIVSYEIVLSRPGSISGFVYDQEGKAISGAEVVWGGRKIRTDKKGVYKINGVNPGYHYIYVSAPGFVKESKSSLLVKEGKETAGINFVLSPAGQVKGNVVDYHSGKPIKGVHISCSGPTYVPGKSEIDGNFFIDGLKPGTYQMYFYRQGYEHFELKLNVLARESVDIGTTRLKLREKYFYPVWREWIFTPGEKVKLYFNAFRIPSVTVEIFEIDVFNEINKAKSKNLSLRDILNSADLSGKEPVYTKKFDISYPQPLSELYERQIDTGNFSEGVYLWVIKPEGLSEKRQWFVVSEVGFVSKSWEGRAEITVFSISKGRVKEASVYIFDDRWNLIKETRTDHNGQFGLSELRRFIVASGSSFAFSEQTGSVSEGYSEKRSVYAYTDRPVYRPEHTVYFKAVARVDQGHRYSLPEFSDCLVKIIAPDGTVLSETSAKPAQSGSVYGEWLIPEDSPTGVYTIEFLTRGKDELAGRCNFKVLEYRKPEFSIETKPAKFIYLPGEKIKVEVLAKYYFGAPVKNAEIMWAVYSREIWEDESAEEEYENEGWWRGALVSSGSMKTDEKGLAFIEIPTKASYERKETYTIEIRMTDLSRREVTSTRQILILPGCFEIIVSSDRYVYAAGQEIPVTISLRHYFTPSAREKQPLAISVSQEKYEAKKRRWSFTEVLHKEITVEGARTTIKIKPAATGYIKILVRGTDQYHNIITGTRYVWISGRDYSWQPKKEIEVISDKNQYGVNEIAKVLINSAHQDLVLLFTIEGQKLFESKVIEMQGNSYLLEIPIKEEYSPRVYLSVSAVKNKNFISGSKPLKIGDNEKLLNVEVTPNKNEFQPGETANYKVKVTDFLGRPVSAELSMAVVDESIYAISGELVPKIEDFFYGNKPNRVSTSYSFFRWHYGGPGKDFPRTDIRKKFKDTAFWLPFTVADENGLAKVRFEFPDNLTTWRSTVRAVTSDTLVGTGVNKVITTKPLIANLVTPRFLVENDRLLISSVIHNRTGEKRQIHVNLKAAGLDLLDEPERTIEVENEQSTRVDWKVKVNSETKATITLFAQSLPYKDGMEVTLPVFFPGSEERYVFAGRCEETKVDTFYLPSGVIPRSIDARAYIYPSLVSGLFTSLDELAKYPYGCVEQTLNAFLPAIQVADTLTRIKKEDLYLLARHKKEFENLVIGLPKKVADGLVKLYNYQNEDGGWGWWQREASNPYTTAYVVFGFAQAKKCGYLINEERLDKAKSFLRSKIYSTTDYNEKTFMLYALDQAEDKDEQVIGEIYKNKEKLNPYTLAQFCLILHNNGDSRARELLDYLCSKMSRLTPFLYYWCAEDGNYSWINHNIEATAFALRAILAIDPKRIELPGIVRYLVMRKRGGMWYSTKDTAVCLFAFTDYLKIFDELSPDYLVSLSVNGSTLAREKVDRKSLEKFSTSVTLPAESFAAGKFNAIKIEKQGKGNLDYSHVIRCSVRDMFMTDFDGGFKVSRRYTELEPREGGEENGNKIHVYDDIQRVLKSGERIRVEIKISGGEKYEYVMIEDPIPAGFEVVDELQGDSWWYCRREVRDEKVTFFTSIWGEKEKTIVYYLRAETPGLYHILATKAQLMYLPEVWGRSQGSLLTVE
ncbi:MAG: carboxypeptidase regulatory-like domain-containing protein [Candidatus Omnitrophica bacterium]|nr:carboxypeptidase regulatory-like domain-containing protein [Candidatus Omnitrophota bacterium]